MISRISLIAFLLPLFCISQTLKGRIIDKVTQLPIETAAVYFDNTTIGTTSNENGEFSITYSDAVQSTLVISYLGYGKVFIEDYRSKNNIFLELVEAANSLDEVYIEYDDGLTRRQKLRLFKKEFLGLSKFAKSCKILNEDDLILKYDKENKALYASSRAPLKIVNKALRYEIAFDIIDFEVSYRYVSIEKRIFRPGLVVYTGTTFFKELKGSKKNKTVKNRAVAYKGSVQHFMRALYNENLEVEGFLIYNDRFKVDEWSFFSLVPVVDSDFKKVTLSDKVSILFKKAYQSELEVRTDEFFVDTYGNYTPIIGVAFGGAMGSQRVGDALPLDYGLTSNK